MSNHGLRVVGSIVAAPGRRWMSLVFLIACLGCLHFSACRRQPQAPDQVPIVQLPSVSHAGLRLDGRLDESAWQQAARSSAFVDPGDGRVATASRVQAQARLFWDLRYLWVAFEVKDPRPSSPFAADAVDPHLWEKSSAVELMIQPGNPSNGRHYYEIQVDVHGAVWDTRFDDYNQPIVRDAAGSQRFGHQEWASGIRIGKSVRPGGYTLELAIPWTSLSSPQAVVPPRPGDTWRMNFYAFRDGQAASVAWSPLLGQGNFHRASRFGRVVFR